MKIMQNGWNVTKNNHGFETITNEQIAEKIEGWEENDTKDEKVDYTEHRATHGSTATFKVRMTVCAI